MRPVTLQTSGVQDSPVCPMDLYIAPFQATITTVVTGAATYSVQWTLDDVWSPTFNPATAQWNPLVGMNAAVADAQETLISPVTAVRLIQTAGAGSVVARIAQAGNGL